MSEPLLRIEGVSKAFPGVQALDQVDLTIKAGEIHALMGENGAGKSTLIKILTGVHQRDAGAIRFLGNPLRCASPKEAELLGISTVYQEVNLVPHLSVAENMMLGRQPRRLGLIDWKGIKVRAQKALARLSLDLDVSQSVSSYPLAIQQMVALGRALDVKAKLLILDEPTSSLDEQEVERLFAVMKALRDEGIATLFVTHFLDQVYAVSNRISVLRNGGHVGSFAASELPRLDLIAAMLGRDPSEWQPGERDGASTDATGKPLLSVRNLEKKGVVGPINLELRYGEVLGVAGLLGSGRTETARLLFGADTADAGDVEVEGRPTRINSPRGAIAEGLAFCSEDRKRDGVVPNLSVRENLILALQASRGAIRRLPAAEQRKIVEHYIEALKIRTPSPETPMRSLSGGNQQKVLLARWLAMQPKVIILDEPTRGIDVGTKAEIENLVRELSKQGVATLLISSELEEITRNCKRVVVLRDRKQIGELSGAPVNPDDVMHMIAHHQEGASHE